MTDKQNDGDNVNFDELQEEKVNLTENDRVLREEIPESLDLNKTIEEFKAAKEYKFIYLVYAVDKTSKYFTPYRFKMVSYENINENCFFILSTEGLMSNSETDVTITPFANFEEDYRLYQKIVKVSRDRCRISIFNFS